MPQDSLRSVVYRSLVPCDDPNGVIEGETIRRSKIGSRKKGHRIDRLSTPKESNRSCIYKEGKDELKSEGTGGESHSPPSYQLLEVSRGAHKLNQMIDSWSNDNSFNGESKDIARDLLKGALDLQESLAMLCKMQEASKYMAQLKRKEKEKVEGVDEMGVEGNESYKLMEKMDQQRTQNGHVSVEGSSRNCVEELKKVINESLVRQKLLPSDENASFDRRKSNFVSDIPSTSSSQSSAFQSSDSASVDFSVASTSKERKGRGPSLIAKLMGLEEFPSESKKKPVINVENVEMMRESKAYLTEQKEDSDPRTLRGIIEAMQRKGLLSSNDVKRLKPQSNVLGSSPKQSQDDEQPPIVIIKPLRFRYDEKEGIFLRRTNLEERPSFPKEKLIEIESKDESLKKISRRQELRNLFLDEKAFDSKEIPRAMEIKEISTERSTGEEKVLNSKEVRRKEEVKEPKTKEKASANKMKVSVPLSHRPHEKETTNRKAEKTQKDLPNRSKSLEKTHKALPNRSKSVEKTHKALPNGSKSVEQTHKALPNVSKSLEKTHKALPNGSKSLEKAQKALPNGSKSVEKTQKALPNGSKSVEKTQKALPNGSKSAEKKNAESLTMSRSKDHVGATSTKPKKPENRLAATKNCIQQKENSSRSHTVARSLQPIAHSSIGRTKNNTTRKAKSVTSSLPIALTTENLEHHNSDLKKRESVSPITYGFWDDQIPTKAVVPEKIGIEEQAVEQMATACEFTLQSNTESFKELKQLGHQETTSHTTTKREFDLKGLLLSSSSFLSCADRLFDLQTSQSTLSETTDIEDYQQRLYLDYANELMERKTQTHFSLLIRRPWLCVYLEDSRIQISLNQLVEEVCEAVGTLRSYTEAGDDVLPVDNIFKILDSDLKAKTMMISDVWDIGWLNGFPVNEALQVVCEVERHILSRLIEEVIGDCSNSIL